MILSLENGQPYPEALGKVLYVASFVLCCYDIMLTDRIRALRDVLGSTQGAKAECYRIPYQVKHGVLKELSTKKIKPVTL